MPACLRAGDPAVAIVIVKPERIAPGRRFGTGRTMEEEALDIMRRSNRSIPSCHCAAVRLDRCLVPRVRVMISFASASWGAASESDGTPDQ